MWCFRIEETAVLEPSGSSFLFRGWWPRAVGVQFLPGFSVSYNQPEETRPTNQPTHSRNWGGKASGCSFLFRTIRHLETVPGLRNCSFFYSGTPCSDRDGPENGSRFFNGRCPMV